jgi:NADPH2:quinone reductase
MSSPKRPSNKQLISLVKQDGQIEVWFEEQQTPELAPDEVLIEVEATPINPSDMPVIFGVTDVSDFTVTGDGFDRRYSAPLPPAAIAALAGRTGTAVLTGMEGCGTVVNAGASPEAQALVGQRVSTIGPGMYAHYLVAKAQTCLPLPAHITPVQGASSYINPLTALGMVETAKREDHKAIIFTAAASNLGGMVHRLCQKDGLGFIGVVRSDEQVAQLRADGVEHVCNLSSPDFREDLIKAVSATGATLAYDAVAGGTLVNELLFCMEQVAQTRMSGFSRYGSSESKQVYIYGGLDTSPTILNRNFGFSYGIGGWLLFHFLKKCTAAERQALNQQVVDGLTTTFATQYSTAIPLEDILRPDVINAYMKRGTGQKYLVMPKGPAQL